MKILKTYKIFESNSEKDELIDEIQSFLKYSLAIYTLLEDDDSDVETDLKVVDHHDTYNIILELYNHEVQIGIYETSSDVYETGETVFIHTRDYYLKYDALSITNLKIILKLLKRYEKKKKTIEFNL